MRFLLTAVAALVASGLAGAMAAVVMSGWADGDEGFILVFLALPLVMLVALAFFCVAGFRRRPKGAIDKAGSFLAGLLAVCLMFIALMEFSTAPTVEIGWRGVKLACTMAAACFAAVLVQWLIFRLGAGNAVPTPPAFGRTGSVSHG